MCRCLCDVLVIISQANRRFADPRWDCFDICYGEGALAPAEGVAAYFLCRDVP